MGVYRSWFLGVPLPGGFEGAFGSENHKKSPCGRGAILGVKKQNSPGAPKWAVQVKALLSGLFKLIKGAFYLLGPVLFDLKGGCGSTFCVVDFALITAFLFVDSPQLQGPKFDQNHGSGPNGALNATISSMVSRRPTPRGAKDYELHS